MTRWGMVIDLEKCTGCQACTLACQMENNLVPGQSWQDVLFYTEGRYPSATLKWFPRPCMHCENPSCVHVCPVNATYKTDDGLVLIDWDRCIGCKYCVIACPYGVRFASEEKPLIEPDPRETFPSKDEHTWRPPWRMPEQREDRRHGVGIPPPGVMTKCTFCFHRISKAPEGAKDLDPNDPATRDYTPACVDACPPTARYFGDIDDPESRVSKLIAEKRGVRLLDHLGNKPQVYYLSGEASTVPSTRALKQS
jgi:molybdopterin-containing oxidoreductase family iron-sulfur binding subunit